MRRRLQGPSQLSTSLYYQLILCIYAAMNWLGGDAKTEFAPETLGTPLYTHSYLRRGCASLVPLWSTGGETSLLLTAQCT